MTRIPISLPSDERRVLVRAFWLTSSTVLTLPWCVLAFWTRQTWPLIVGAVVAGLAGLIAIIREDLTWRGTVGSCGRLLLLAAASCWLSVIPWWSSPPRQKRKRAPLQIHTRRGFLGARFQVTHTTHFSRARAETPHPADGSGITCDGRRELLICGRRRCFHSSRFSSCCPRTSLMRPTRTSIRCSKAKRLPR
jgi:hypothetical protein